MAWGQEDRDCPPCRCSHQAPPCPCGRRHVWHPPAPRERRRGWRRRALWPGRWVGTWNAKPCLWGTSSSLRVWGTCSSLCVWGTSSSLCGTTFSRPSERFSHISSDSPASTSCRTPSSAARRSDIACGTDAADAVSSRNSSSAGPPSYANRKAPSCAARRSSDVATGGG